MSGYMKQRREKSRAEGKCTWCLEPSPERSLCEACRAKQRERYHAARKSSLCTRCGKPSGGKWACIVCREAAAASPEAVADGVAETTQAAAAPSRISGRWYITDHALAQFLAHHGEATGCTDSDAALRWMVADSRAAKLAHTNKHTGSPVWVGARPWRIRYVIGDPPHRYRDGLRPVVTVLPNNRRSRCRA